MARTIGLWQLSQYHLLFILFILFLVVFLSYVIYQRHFHPLSRFPGPFWASLTDLWKIVVLRTGRMPELMCLLHKEYGNIVRIGPNELSFNDHDAATDIYKAGRVMEKGPFYDGFTSFKPNVFGLRNEDFHALRRRQMAHSFSVTALKSMEPIFDENVANLRTKLDEYCQSGQEFDLKKLITAYQYDLMGELAFSFNFGSQLSIHYEIPEFNDHFYLACIYGMIPNLLPYSMKLGSYIPLTWMRKLVKSRENLRKQTIACVSRSIAASEKERDRSLLTYVIEAKDPVTGERLSPVDIYTEAFGFLVAGSHTTSGTITMLLSNLFDHPEYLRNVLLELGRELPPLTRGESYKFSGLEAKLPYTLACVRENFRIFPVASIPLSRKITPVEGLRVGDHHLPQGTLVCVINSCLHHNPALWGTDHDSFIPERWIKPGAPNPNLLLHFGAGHRTCMGRNLATMSIWKVLTTILRCYEFVQTDPANRLEPVSLGLSERKGPLVVRVRERESQSVV